MPHMTHGQREAVILACDLFRSLPSHKVASLARASRDVLLDAGETVRRRGETGDALHVVARGGVRLFLSSAQAKELGVLIAGPGMAIGVTDMLDGHGAVLHATTQETSILLRLPYAAIRRIVAERDLHTAMLEHLSWQVRHLTETLEDVALHPLEVRVARLIHRLNRQSRSNSAARPHRLDQATIATLANGTRPRVNEQLQKLQRRGAIEIRAGLVVVSSPDILTQTALLG